jgi:hypothetical protein
MFVHIKQLIQIGSSKKEHAKRKKAERRTREEKRTAKIIRYKDNFRSACGQPFCFIAAWRIERELNRVTTPVVVAEVD